MSNTSMASADLISASTTGVVGALYNESIGYNKNFFRVSVAPSAKVTFDFLGDWLAYYINFYRWRLSLSDATGGALGFDTGAPVSLDCAVAGDDRSCCHIAESCYTNTRITQSYTNTTGARRDVYIKVLRSEPSYPVGYISPYSMTVKLQ